MEWVNDVFVNQQNPKYAENKSFLSSLPPFIQHRPFFSLFLSIYLFIQQIYFCFVQHTQRLSHTIRVQ